MRKIIIADTSCLILLFKIGELKLLTVLFGEIIITSIIANEFGQQLPEWIKVANAENKNYEKLLSATVDIGKASAIALAVEQTDCLLILDDHKARSLANELGLKVTGTLGVIADAKLSGHISSIKPILNKIRETNFRLSPEIERLIIEKSGEK